jgi:hypothetical protein
MSPRTRKQYEITIITTDKQHTLYLSAMHSTYAIVHALSILGLSALGMRDIAYEGEYRAIINHNGK